MVRYKGGIERKPSVQVGVRAKLKKVAQGKLQGRRCEKKSVMRGNLVQDEGKGKSALSRTTRWYDAEKSTGRSGGSVVSHAEVVYVCSKTR